MIFLLLHITCSCIRTLHSLYSYILNYVGTFLIVFLSLSFFLFYVSRIMAPKRKSTLSRNPLRSRASSSSNPTPSFVWFHDENACKDFLKNFCRRGIHSECHVILSDFSNIDLPTVIHSRVGSHFVTSRSLVHS